MKLRLSFQIFTFIIFQTSYAQNFNVHLSGTRSIINTIYRFQLELPIKDKISAGMNMNYYSINWKGATFEPFIRIYNKKHGNSEGFFGQGKLIYGNLSTLSFEDYLGALENERWNTFGFGFSGGYKFLLFKHLTIEPLIGFRFLTEPVYKFKPGVNKKDYDRLQSVDWYLSTGLPLDIQLKIGAQF